MGDPLFTPALVGHVSAFFKEVVNAAKGAYGHKKKCQMVLESVKKLQSNINNVDNLDNWEEAESDELNKIKDLLKKAEDFARTSLEESKYEKAKRAMSVWQWGKLPSELLEIVRQIEEAKRNFLFSVAIKIYREALKPRYVSQDLASYIVGVDKPFREHKESLLAAHARNMASHFGLYGAGGAGKTLLAQMLHNDKDIKDTYGAHFIMWITVGRDAKVRHLYKQMATYLNYDEFDKKYANLSLKIQRKYLMNALSKKRVFLILDDVWQTHCEDDHEMIYWLNIAGAFGSATLLTSRNTSLLSGVHDAESEFVLSLSEEDSWKLFCFHAFKDNLLPSTILEELAKDVCKECKGLPLALKVIGGAMVDKVGIEEWRSALHDMKQPELDIIEHDEIFGCLRFSYDELKDDTLKTCFLYFGAFQEDHKIPTKQLFDIWISEELFGSIDKKEAKEKAMIYLGMLEKRALIHWNDEEAYVQVQDVLRDFALYIIDKAQPKECAYRCFFQTSEVIKQFPSSERLQAIERISFMNSTNFSRWPKDVGAPNLKVLLLSSISNEREGKWPDFKRFPTLRYLDLSKCQTLEELPRSIGELEYLTTLDLSYCRFLEELPASIGQLACLITLNLCHCEFLEQLPTSMGKLKCLTTLNLSHCKSLKELPASIRELKSKCLKTLDLSNCDSLKEKIFHEASDQQDYLPTLALNMLPLEIQQQLKTAEECIEALKRMPSRKINNEQCEYLVEKLEMVTKRIRAEAHQSNSNVVFRSEKGLERLPALAIQIKSFVESCCKDTWLHVAMTLTNTAEHVSSIGTDLEICTVDLDRKEPGSLTLKEVLDINEAELKIVKTKADSDVNTLRARVSSEFSSGTPMNKILAKYLLQRLSRSSQPRTPGVVNCEESLWNRFINCVQKPEHIGIGGCATVYEATWLGMRVAKKTFDGDENAHFMKEVKIFEKLCHPNVTSMFCCGKDSGKRSCVIIMELMDKDLKALMQKRCSTPESCPFSILEGVDIMYQIGEGMKYLHDQGIVHRDLKSSNILVKVVKDKRSEIEHVHAKVADFGLSKMKESSIMYTQQTHNEGTNRWMAPEIINLSNGDHADEQGTSENPKYPKKPDVYSFALVCYEILTGRIPFQKENDTRKVKQWVLDGKRPDLPDHCPPLLKALIAECWTQEPNKRPDFDVICSKLKYLKYLLMTGTNVSPSTSMLTQSPGNIDSSTV